MREVGVLRRRWWRWDILLALVVHDLRIGNHASMCREDVQLFAHKVIGLWPQP
jgi:hypothetical protein